MARKLGMNATKRMALIKNQASALLWHGKIETTLARAEEVEAYVAKILTLAVNTYTDTVESEVVVTDAKGKETKKTLVKDGNKKLNARRKIMTMVNDLQEVKGFKESKSEFKRGRKRLKARSSKRFSTSMLPNTLPVRKKRATAAAIREFINSDRVAATLRK